MSGVNNILVDTNIIILAISGDIRIRQYLEGQTLFISVITEIELLSIPFTSSLDVRLMREFISNCFVIDLDNEIKHETIQIRKKLRVKLPDAIIASSRIKKLPLLTADKGFSKIIDLNAIIV